MTTTIYRTIPGLLVMALFLSGCAGFVGGDLRNTKSDYRMPSCPESPTRYQVKYMSDAKDDYGNQNIPGFVSSLTLGIVPTYWTSVVHSKATIVLDGKGIYTREYNSRIHKFYGILWGLVLPLKSINALQSDEGGGIRIEWGIRDRTLYKVVADFGGKEDQFCLINENTTNPLPGTALQPTPMNREQAPTAH